MSDGRIQVIHRAVDILKVLACGPASLTEVSQATGLPKGTTFRILTSLRYEDLVVKDPLDSRYVLGSGFLRLGRNPLQGFGAIVRVAKPALTELWRATEETITLHARLGAARVCIDEIVSPLPIRYKASVGATVPLHVGSAGKVLLAHMDESELERFLQSSRLEALTAETVVDRRRLAEELALIQRRGWAVSAGERVPGAAAISVPARARPDVLLAVSILGPADRLTAPRRLAFLDDLRATAAAIERAMTAAHADVDWPGAEVRS